MQTAQLAVRAAEAVDAAEAVRLAQQLVQIPSHYPGPGEAAVVEFLGNYLADRGFETRLYNVAPARPNLIADLGEGAGGVIFEGHTDVVTPGDPATWSIPPYEGAIRDGRLHGRGAADMKGGVAAAVVAAGVVRGLIRTPARSVRLALLADEEGMMLGVKAFIRDGHAQGFSGAIVCEPEENELCLWQKGAIRYRVLFKGKMAHGALPHTGKNPILPAARYAVLAQALEGELQREGPHPYLGWPYVTPTVFIASAGEGQHNVIPDVAELRLDVRTIPRTGHAAIGVRLAELLTEALGESGVEATLELVDDRPATETPGDAGVVRAVERALKLLGQPVRYGGVLGATDGTFLHATAGLPIVTLGPGGRLGPHQVDESVSLDEIVTAARVYAASMVLACSADEEGCG